MRTYRYMVCALALVAVVPVPALAAWIDYPQANLPVCTASGWQALPQSVADGSGGVVVVWPDSRIGSNYIYAQRISANGEVQWTANGVALCTAAVSQYPFTIVSDGAGGAIVSWQDGRGIDINIYAQRISADGVVQWAADGVALCTATGDQSYPAIASDGTGGAIVTWSDFRNGSWDIYAQRITADGAVQWTPNGVALCSATGHQYYPAIASDGAGGAIVTWHDPRSGNLDIYAQKITAAGAVQWAAQGVALCTATGDQYSPIIASDGAGGAIVSWWDYRSGCDIYAQRISADGSVQWAATGVALCTATGDQYYPCIASDGAGGAIVTWSDRRSGSMDIYAQRISAAGAVQWAAQGVALCTATGDQYGSAIASDGAGGAIVGWKDGRGGNAYDAYAQRVSPAGAPQWLANGVALSVRAYSTTNIAAIAADGTGGAVVAWETLRSGTDYDIYAQRVFASGRVGDVSPAPVIAGARDTPNDQGGKLKLMWNASPIDADPYDAIADYRIWRSVPPAFAQSALASGARLVEGGEQSALEPRRSFRATHAASGIVYWEYYGTQVARRFAGYSMVVNTVCDSVAGSNSFTLFLVEARCVDGVTYWDSAPDSGYSVDNLSPPTPVPFVATYSNGSNTLHWTPSRAPDLREFRLYRGPSRDFVPGPSNLVAATRDTGYVDAPGSVCYKLAAVDVHGNASRFALVSPDGPIGVLASLVEINALADRVELTWYTAGNPGLQATVYRRERVADWSPLGVVTADGSGYLRYTDGSVMTGTRYGYRLGIMDGGEEVFVGEAWATAEQPRFSLAGASPNPAHGGRLTVDFVLPTSERAQLELFDVTGRRVAGTEVGSLGPGQHTVDLSQGLRVPPGLYLVRLTQGANVRSTRTVVLK